MGDRSGSALRHLEADLAGLARDGLLRSPAIVPADCLVLCSNDYLGYARLELPAARGGSGASRLISGDCEEHRAAESALASWVGCDAALLFSSGYAANLGTLAALVGPEDVVVSDALNHASIIDGCRLSRARVVVVPHLDVAAVERALAGAKGCRRRWVVTEGYFSMDGDVPDLAALRAVCDAANAALVVDEAHALGVLGPAGAGACAEVGVRPDVLVGTLGKALGLQGAFVAGPAALRLWLWNRSRSFVFSTGVSPAIAAAVPGRVARAAADDGGRAKMRAASLRLGELIRARSGRPPGTPGLPILPWITGTPGSAVETARRLAERGVLVQPIRPPTVPAGTSRLRLTATASLGEAELARAADALLAIS
jgi:8-amino-7-oxononanoate synthase